MSNLAKLKAAAGLDDVAKILGYKPSALAYLLYVLPAKSKYSSFAVPKKSGGTRIINAPDQKLKTLQRHLANLLNDCQQEISKARGTSHHPLAHGFTEGYSIATNANGHTRRRFVLNLDLKDFFPSFNFGRVRGFFIKNRDYALNEKVATVLAQIASHDNQLPQGSPCSPVISNIITHVLDIRLGVWAAEGIARIEGCGMLGCNTGHECKLYPLLSATAATLTLRTARLAA